MARSLNRVQLIGNLTRDPELRYTPNGNAVCSFGIATNRSWTTDSGEKREEVDFHNIIAWNKLGELCSQFLLKGRKVYVEGRLSTRSWTGQDGQQKTRTEIVINDMILLDNKFQQGGAPLRPSDSEGQAKGTEVEEIEEEVKEPEEAKETDDTKETKGTKAAKTEEVMPDDIPF
jgi:single-strand DNA-binding protein